MNVTSIAARRKDDRGALAAAIAKAAKARELVTAHQAAIERAESLLSEAESRFEAASAAVNAARAAHAKQVVQEITAGSRPAPSSLLRSARAAAEDAEDAVTAGRAALRQLESGTAELESVAWLAEQEVEAEIDSLMTPIARTVLAEAKQLEAELATHQAVLAIIHEFGVVPRFADERVAWRARELRLEAAGGRELREDVVRHMGAVDSKRPTNEAADAFRRAREALRRDSGAPLPTIEQ
jgi:hypothetical protein